MEKFHAKTYFQTRSQRRVAKLEDARMRSSIFDPSFIDLLRQFQALKFKGEAKGMCCAAGKIKLPQLKEPPEPLKTLLARYTAESKRSLSKIRKYNSCSK
ncbi:unnamed protein product [Onchocerca ochengi]|uniref:SRP_SPB domain-containing protein n=1 Tax=Onchocerca ochengi TaxID=42157 RepID=A0A182EHT4_ONCOC|nr:unnamed protein product [Onchocerca ochengi]